jgi:hypothetical protein
MSREQKIRFVLFYLSVTIFLIGLPFILSFSLGYKLNPRTLQFTKTGLIVLKTQPSGANVYLENRLLNEKTPLTINELLPGRYSLKVELEKHYPWVADTQVEAGKVTRLEKIILFPLRANIKQLNKDKVSSFWIDEGKERIYYINQEENIIYKSDLEGENFQELARIPEIPASPGNCKLSADKEKLLCFNHHKIAVVYLELQNGLFNKEQPKGQPYVLRYPQHNIIDVFWHSDSYHLIIITNSDIVALEAAPQATPVSLVTLNKRNTSAFYDTGTDTLYFLDSQKAADGNFYDNIYKIELNPEFFTLRELIKIRPNEKE